MVWSGQPADSWDELELVDDDDREIDLLDDLDEWGWTDRPQATTTVAA